MIEKSTTGEYCLYCDLCGEEARLSFATFGNAIDYARFHGWSVPTRPNQWEDICPECREG